MTPNPYQKTLQTTQYMHSSQPHSNNQGSINTSISKGNRIGQLKKEMAKGSGGIDLLQTIPNNLIEPGEPSQSTFIPENRRSS